MLDRRQTDLVILHWPCLLAFIARCFPAARKFLCTPPVTVAQSSSSGVAICYVLPVLRMTLCLHIFARNSRRENEKGVYSRHRIYGRDTIAILWVKLSIMCGVNG